MSRWRDEYARLKHESEEERRITEYWIDRYGREIRYQPIDPYYDRYDETTGEYTHIERVCSYHDEIIRQVFGEDTTLTREDVMKQHGWIQMGSTCYHFPLTRRKPTQSQLDKLFDLGYIRCEEEFFYGSTERFWHFYRE